MDSLQSTVSKTTLDYQVMFAFVEENFLILYFKLIVNSHLSSLAVYILKELKTTQSMSLTWITFLLLYFRTLCKHSIFQETIEIWCSPPRFIIWFMNSRLNGTVVKIHMGYDFTQEKIISIPHKNTSAHYGDNCKCLLIRGGEGRGAK